MSVKTFFDITSLMYYVFETVPWTVDPYTGNEHKKFSKNIEVIDYFKNRFLKKEIGGWCGLNCEFFKRILFEHKYSATSFNYGIEGILTHITIVVNIDGAPYLFDPYFNRYYTIMGKPIPFDDLLKLIKIGATQDIKSVYGDHKKPIQQEDGSWIMMTGKELEESVVNEERRRNLSKPLKDMYGSDDLFNLMRILLFTKEHRDFVTNIHRDILI